MTFIPSILFILSNHDARKVEDRINKMNRMDARYDRLILHFIL